MTGTKLSAIEAFIGPILETAKANIRLEQTAAITP